MIQELKDAAAHEAFEMEYQDNLNTLCDELIEIDLDNPFNWDNPAIDEKLEIMSEIVLYWENLGYPEFVEDARKDFDSYIN